MTDKEKDPNKLSGGNIHMPPFKGTTPIKSKEDKEKDEYVPPQGDTSGNETNSDD